MLSTILSTSLLLSLVSSAPTPQAGDFSPDGKYFPLANGFPNPSAQQVSQIQIQAKGTLPNGPPPSAVSPDGVTNLKLIALNELSEVAYFSELLYNVTNKVHGYDLGHEHNQTVAALTAIIAQEELHLLNANGALSAFGLAPIQPCKYVFPVNDYASAIGLAAIFTDLVLGTLQDVNQIFAENGDSGLVRAVSSVIGNEAEQEGFFRVVLKKRPSAQPFLTTAVRDFAFTALQGFTVPGSCPNIDTIPLKTFKALSVNTAPIEAKSQTLKFSFAKKDAGTKDYASLSLVYINALNVPIVEPLKNVKVEGEMVSFEAGFPFEENLLYGLTIAAVTNCKGPFTSADQVARVTVFGPGLIEIE